MWPFSKKKKLDANDCDKAIYLNEKQVRCGADLSIRNRENCKKCPKYKARFTVSKS